MHIRQNNKIALADKIFHDQLPKEILNKILGLIPSKVAVQKHLMAAIDNGNLAHVQQLIFYSGADVNAIIDNTTPLHLAVAKNQLRIVSLLLKNSANIDIKNTDGITPLYLAITEGNFSIIKLLLKQGADFNVTVECFIKMSLLSATLLTYESKANSKRIHYQNTSFLKTRRQLKPFDNIVMQIIPESFEIFDGYSCLTYAAKLGHFNLVQALLKNNINPNFEEEKFPELRGARDNFIPLRYAVKYHHFQVAKELLKFGADPNTKDIKGKTALHFATNTKMAKLLLRNKAEINSIDNQQRLPIHLAVKRNNIALVELLIKNKADINFPGEFAKTPLYYATANGNKEMIALLLDNMTKLNDVTEDEIKPYRYSFNFFKQYKMPALAVLTVGIGMVVGATIG
jgi:ankyrin repeat protein